MRYLRFVVRGLDVKTTDPQETRNTFQVAIEHKFISAVERLSGREVLAVSSMHRVGPDMEVKAFMLKPAPGGDT